MLLDERLQNPLATLRGMTPRRQRLLEKMGLLTYEDLLFCFPRRYEQWQKIEDMRQLVPGEPVLLQVQILSDPLFRRMGKRTMLSTSVSDGFRTIRVTWFNSPYLRDKLRRGDWILLRGKVDLNKAGYLQFVNPKIESVGAERRTPLPIEETMPPVEAGADTAKEEWNSVYPLTAGLGQHDMRRLVANLLEELGELTDPLPEWLREEEGLLSADEAYHAIHFAQSREAYDEAKTRLVFEELFYLQLRLATLKRLVKSEHRAYSLAFNEERLLAYKACVEALPFQLTLGQTQVLNELARDLSRTRPMNRLVQGDVGSGKTVLAALAMYQAHLAGTQAVLMVPTSILAEQHFQTLQALLPKTCRLELLTGSLKASEKKRLLADIASGAVHLVVGTQALLEDGVRFARLGLAVTDEQHRFGVRQRVRLGGEAHSPHVLVMSATPIPRSLALIIYGDLDLSILSERPKGRQPIETKLVRPSDAKRIERWLSDLVRRGEQAYIVCPMIHPDEEGEGLSSVESYLAELSEALPQIRFAALHGELSAVEKQSVMEAFYRGDVQVLVSTTVVEVGVDNPNATGMLIKNAERFGLAQLHQLRGRIGRGEKASTCLVEQGNEEALGSERLKTFVENEDGFVLAEADLKLRGPGEFFGLRQHGLPEFRLANLYEDQPLLRRAQGAVHRLLERDLMLAEPEQAKLRALLEQLYGLTMQSPGL